MTFTVGETVVYPNHGAAVIEDIEMRTIKGEDRQYLVLRIVAQQDLVVRGHYKANMVVMNIGGFPFTTGPTEAAYVVNDLVRPNSVIASHANEPATSGGKLMPNSKTAAFQKAVKAPVHIPLSGKTMEFNGAGRCVAGC